MVVALSDIMARQTTGKKMEEIRESCCDWACRRSEREAAKMLMTREWLKMKAEGKTNLERDHPAPLAAGCCIISRIEKMGSF
ncbi:hypothetical protein ACFX1R_010890 [Malus domestica]